MQNSKDSALCTLFIHTCTGHNASLFNSTEIVTNFRILSPRFNAPNWDLEIIRWKICYTGWNWQPRTIVIVIFPLCIGSGSRLYSWLDFEGSEPAVIPRRLEIISAFFAGVFLPLISAALWDGIQNTVICSGTSVSALLLPKHSQKIILLKLDFYSIFPGAHARKMYVLLRFQTVYASQK